MEIGKQPINSADVAPVAPVVRVALVVPEDPVVLAVPVALVVPEDPVALAVRVALVVVLEDPVVLAAPENPVVLAVRENLVALVVPESPAVPLELALGPVVAPELELAPVAVALRTKSVTTAHRRGLVPAPRGEDSAVAAETTREPVAVEAVKAWAVAE
jgi:hypothetical protein